MRSPDEGPRPARIVLIATPIGNLGDLAPRAIKELGTADIICCEDTRRTRALLSASGLSASNSRLVSLYAHNEAARIPEVIEWVLNGRTVAVVVDAGTPGISDPGERLVRAAGQAGIEVACVPGPSSVIAALMVSGLPCERFCMEGFLPRKGKDRLRRIELLAHEQRTSVILESPVRLVATLSELLVALGDREVVIARELTKLYEEVWRGMLGTAVSHFGRAQVRGEIVIVLAGANPPVPKSDEFIEAAVRSRLSEGGGTRLIANDLATELGVSRHRIYELVLRLRSEDPR